MAACTQISTKTGLPEELIRNINYVREEDLEISDLANLYKYKDGVGSSVHEAREIIIENNITLYAIEAYGMTFAGYIVRGMDNEKILRISEGGNMNRPTFNITCQINEGEYDQLGFLKIMAGDVDVISEEDFKKTINIKLKENGFTDSSYETDRLLVAL